MNAAAGTAWFFTLDLKNGDWHVEVYLKHRGQAAFTAGQGLQQFKVMAFGLPRRRG